MPWQNSYTTAAPTNPTIDYSTTAPLCAPTTTLPPYRNIRQDGFITIKTVTTTVFADADSNDWSGQVSGPTRDQGAIIALGVICGLLTVGLAVLLLVLFYQGGKRIKKMEGELVISPGYQAMGRRKHRRDRTEGSNGGTDDMDSCSDLMGFYAPRKHRRNRRSQPVTCEKYQRAGGNPGLWGSAGAQAQPAAYGQFANPTRHMLFQPGQVNEHGVPGVQIPTPAQGSQPRRGIEKVMSSTEQSEVSSSSHGGPLGHHHSSVRQSHSRTSSSHRGRSGRR